MHNFHIGDIVARKSYGGDIPFTIVDITNTEDGKTVYILKGLLHRLQADSSSSDLIRQNPARVYFQLQRYRIRTRRYAYRNLSYRLRGKPGKILHIDSSKELMNTCMKHYRESTLDYVGKLVDESRQPQVVKQLLEQYRPDILILTGHDSIKKGHHNLYSIDSYSSSKYFIQSVKEARKYESSHDKLCIYAGACQSYYEAIMDAGADFASSPGRIMIKALDPAFVAEKIALTDRGTIVTPEEIAKITLTGSKGIWGIDTRGHFIKK